MYCIVWAMEWSNPDLFCRLISKNCQEKTMIIRLKFSASWWRSNQSHLQQEWNSETSGEKSISHGKTHKTNLAYFTLQGTSIMLNIQRKVEDHANHVRWIYVTSILNMRESPKYARTIWMYSGFILIKTCSNLNKIRPHPCIPELIWQISLYM